MDKETLYKLAKEYVDIVEVLREEYREHILEIKNKIYVRIDLFNYLLEQKKFYSVQEKKKKWRDLQWIICDKDRGRFTKIVKINGEIERKVVIRLEPLETLKYLK